MMAEERLQKLIARSGLCSRREADRMIKEGRVTVNGRSAVLGDKADPDTDHVKVDGKRLKAPETHRYVLLYKPRAVMTTCDDPEERTTVIDLVRPIVKERIFPVGRLDYHSEGLLLLTNDGELAARVTHPRYGVVREYMVKIRGDLDEGEIQRLRAGAVVDGHHVKPLSAERVRSSAGGTSTWWRVEVTEGRTHEVRQLFFRAGRLVQRLRRSAIGPLRDDSLRSGDFRMLTASEVAALRRAAGQRPEASPAKRGRKKRPGVRADTARTDGPRPRRARKPEPAGRSGNARRSTTSRKRR
jgi:23S rRNA pseudouridine2605 synthase